MKILCDTHVHCYRFEEFGDLCDAAIVNFEKQGKSDAKVLFFTDGQTDKTWSRLQQELASGFYKTGGWTLTYLSEATLIQASKDQELLYLAPARQINSVNKLEYLLLGCDQALPEGMPDEDILDQFGGQYAVICPWSFGKWLGARGKLISDLAQRKPERFSLGDNGGRPWLWAWVPQFRNERSQVINGSDPLPLLGEIKRVGSYGIQFDLQGSELNLGNLVKTIKASQHKNFGSQLGLLKFISLQIALRRAGA